MTERCIGCGAEFERVDGPVHRYMTSAPGCFARYGELLGVLSVEPSLQAARMMCVDAYATQHPGTPVPPAIQSVAVHLLNMYSYLRLHHPVTLPRFAGHKGAFHWLEPPSFVDARTVLMMPTSASGEAITQAARQWAESVWEAWRPHHPQIVAGYAKYAAQ